ncbi:MAG: hypothetical protein LBL63_04075 [Clostridiales Family XIII bacterium]|nr:hypothetical protein [Clostridiales Family XIII bacterium]
MEIKFKFIGMMKALVEGKSELTLDLTEHCTVADALLTLGIDYKTTKQFNFAVVNGKKEDPQYVLQPTDDVKIFPRSFGG